MTSPIQHAGSRLTAPIILCLLAGFSLPLTALAQTSGGDKEFAAAIQAVANPREVTSLDLTGWTLGEATLAELKKFPALEELHLNPGLGDSALAQIRSLTKLRYLDLRGCPITDAGVARLVAMPQLVEVDLSETRITDQGLTTLSRLPNLKTAHLYKTPLTAEGVARFIQTRPNIQLVGAVLPALPPPPAAIARTRPASTPRPGTPASGAPATSTPAPAEVSATDQEAFRKLNEIAKALRRYAGFKQGNLPEEVDKIRAFLARADDLIDPWGNGFVYYGSGLNQFNGPEAAPILSTDQPRDDQRWVLTLGGKAQAIPEKNFLALITRHPNLKPQQATAGNTLRPVALAPAPASPPASPAQPAPASEPLKLASSGSAILDQQRDRFLEQVRAVDPDRITIDADGNVSELRLSGMKIGDANLIYLKAMPKLVALDLSKTGVTDAGLNHLLTLKKLKRLNLMGTGTTYAGIQPLLQSMPGISIDHASLR